MRKTLLILGVVLCSFYSNAALHTISSNATWTSLSTTWANVNDYDVVRIAAGTTLFINDADCDDLENTEIILEVYGTLMFANNGSQVDALYLSSGSSILIYGNGEVDAYNCNGKKQIYFGGNLVATCNGGTSTSFGTGYYTFNDINTAGGIGASGPVPVTWLNYEAIQMTSGVQINWSTATEIDNSHFEIEYSTDGENWIFVDLVQSKAENGRSESILEYSYDHIADLNGTVYYRIKQVDYDNDFEYTDAIAVELKEMPKVVIATKGEGKISLNVESKNNSTTNVKIYDLAGNLVNDLELIEFTELTFDEPNIYIFEFTKNKVTDVVKHYVL